MWKGPGRGGVGGRGRLQQECGVARAGGYREGASVSGGPGSEAWRLSEQAGHLPELST